ncbi:hypothetical protein DV735_g4335, partial [Chaetothyriales sp. CBS 134920]
MSDSSEHAADSLWFSIGRRRDKSTSSGTAVSPTGSVGRPPTPVNRRRARPPIRQRPHSDTITVRSRAKVRSIEEDLSDNQAPRTLHYASDGELPSTDRRLPTSPRAARSATVAPHRRSLSHLRRLVETRARSEASVLTPRHPGRSHVWPRSKSGGVWYDRLRPSRSQSKNSSQGSDASERMMRLALTPLRPPQLPVPDPIEHEVRVETPFTEITRENTGSSESAALPDAGCLPLRRKTSRRGAIHPRARLPLGWLLKTLNPGHGKKGHQSKEGPRLQKPSSKRWLPDHRSLLRRNRPAEALKQVTSILEEISPQSVINPLSKRAFSDTSGPDGRDARRQPKQKKLISSHTLNKSFPNFVHFDSQDSSQLDLRCGPCPSPQNTPEERAIYRVKRSSSAETEEFLKIDVSIRGGTSYLPSEARRVHTPPPPHAGLDGRRRGFFFDYNAPQWCDKSLPGQLAGASQGEGLRLQSTHQSRGQPSNTALTIGRQLDPLKRCSRFKTQRDWYDAKLAELESNDCEAGGRLQHDDKYEFIEHINGQEGAAGGTDGPFNP